MQSDGAGRIEIAGVTPGDYLLQARFRGFAPLREPVTFVAGQAVHRTLTLSIGSVQESISVTASPAPDSATRPIAKSMPSAQRPCSPSATGGHITPPTKVRDVRPIFPGARPGGATQGRVMLEATITTDGTVRETSITSPVDADLEDAAIAAVDQWQFTPTLLNCVPIAIKINVVVDFKSAP